MIALSILATLSMSPTRGKVAMAVPHYPNGSKSFGGPVIPRKLGNSNADSSPQTFKACLTVYDMVVRRSEME
jgi:hypothetical protein